MRLLSAVALVLVLALPAAPQDEPVSVTASAGVAGFVDPAHPVRVEVTVTSEVLFVGVVEVEQGPTTVRIPVEVPAGTEKVYELTVPPPVAQQQGRVRLLGEGVEEPVATASLAMRTNEDELLVGVAEWPEAAGALGGVRTEVGGVPVHPLEVDLARPLEPLSYLAAGRLPPEDSPIWEWVARGGRLVVPRADGLSADPIGFFPRTSVPWFTYGEGELLVVEDASDPSTWSTVLRPTPLSFGARDFWQTPERPLSNAAGNGGDQRVPSLPWLLGAILGYAALVGPVNFLVLKRTGRRDLAWVTVPLLGLLAMGAFWLAGRERLEAVVVNHASLLIGGDRPAGRTAVVLAAGTAGEHRLEFPEAWVVYPGQVGEAADQFGRPVIAATGEVVGSSITYRLPQLGFAGAHALYEPDALPRVSLEDDGDGLEVGVENHTDLEFWAWGVGGVGGTRVAEGPLAPGGSGRLEVGGGAGRGPEGMVNIGDAVVQARQLWNDDRSWRVLYPLGEAAGFLLDQRAGPFFFGYTEGYRVEVGLDGSPRQVEGTSLVVVPLPDVLPGLGRAPASLLSTGDAGFLDRGPGFLFVHTDSMLVGFDLPAGLPEAPELAWTNLFGDRPGEFEVWDWASGSFQPIQVGERIDLARHRLPTGEVLLQVSAPVEGEMVEAPLSPASIELRWPA